MSRDKAFEKCAKSENHDLLWDHLNDNYLLPDTRQAFRIWQAARDRQSEELEEVIRIHRELGPESDNPNDLTLADLFAAIEALTPPQTKDER